MNELHRFRMAVAKHLGKPLSPEIAAQIEVEAFHQHDASIDPARFAPHEYCGLVFAVESFRLIVDELHPLHEQHFAETERYRDGQKLNPDYDKLRAAERAGKMVQFTARYDGELVGNIRMYLFEDTHTGTKGATEDTLYLTPEARIGFAASQFIAYAENVLAELGIEDVWCDTKILYDEHGHVVRDVGVLLKRRGYDHVANRFHKRLTKEKHHVLT